MSIVEDRSCLSFGEVEGIRERLNDRLLTDGERLHGVVRSRLM